ncbi:MAG: C-glycoside deglycosidase beta subunit domain-containing protein [Thermoproteota archaeon]
MCENMIPSFMLRQLYVKGSLQNIKEGDQIKGYSFKLRNNLGSGTIKGTLNILVDEAPIEPELVSIRKGENEFSVKELETKSMPFDIGDEVTFIVRKEGGLQPGTHKITINSRTLEYGKIEISFSDEVS